MSFLTNPYVRTLWDSAMSEWTEIDPSRTFWNHVLSKEFFTEYKYLLSCSFTPVSEGLWRLMGGVNRQNFAIKSIGEAGSAADSDSIICVVESAAPNDEPQSVEKFVLDACGEYLRDYDLSWVYAMTTIGTSVKLWKCHALGGHQLRLENLLRPPHYINADSDEMIWVAEWFARMKRELPERRPRTGD